MTFPTPVVTFSLQFLYSPGCSSSVTCLGVSDLGELPKPVDGHAPFPFACYFDLGVSFSWDSCSLCLGHHRLYCYSRLCSFCVIPDHPSHHFSSSAAALSLTYLLPTWCPLSWHGGHARQAVSFSFSGFTSAYPREFATLMPSNPCHSRPQRGGGSPGSVKPIVPLQGC